jgi:hypothetical protein
MLLKLIACNVFTRESCLMVAESPHVVDMEFTELGEHVHSATLRALIQGRIDAAEQSGKGYAAILLGFGICGNATVGVQARTIPLVLPRAHDCCTVLLGSRQTFEQHFKDHPSTPFSSSGYIERGQYYLRKEEGESKVFYGDVYKAYVEQYGEENARFIMDTMHPPPEDGDDRAVFIDIPETRHLDYERQFREKAAQDGKTVTTLPGSLTLLRKLVTGAWDPEEFLVVQPGQSIQGVYDWNEVVRAGSTP